MLNSSIESYVANAIFCNTIQ